MLKLASVQSVCRGVFAPLNVARGVHHYEPRKRPPKPTQKGRVPVRTGGSIKGSTLVHGKYGLRLKSEGVRLKAIQLQEADNSIMRALRPLDGVLYRRLHTNISVYIKGNETRMGKGKGSFDHWMCRVPTGKIIFEIDGAKVPLSVAKEAFRIAKDKLPGNYEFVTRDSLPKAGFVTVPRPQDRPAVDYREVMQANPTPKWASWSKAKDSAIRKFLRR